MKLKFTLMSVLSIFLGTTSLAQWEATNASNSTNNSILDFCEHTSNLYTSSYEGIKKWDVVTEQWNTVPFSGFQVYPQEYIGHLVSAGNFLYATKWNPYCAANTVYKSSDNGLTFVIDTMGLPRAPVCDSLPSAILAMFSRPDGKVVIEFGAGFYSKYPNDPSWVLDNTNQRYMAFGTNAWYRLNTSALFKSIDDGQTWTTSAAASFPPGLQPSVLEVNSETGRIYMNAKYGFDNVSLYTDDEGTTWDTLPVNNVLGNSWIGIAQIVTSLVAKGDFITIGAVQNSNPSHPDIYVSNDGGLTFTPDTVGLPYNAGIEDPNHLYIYNDALFLVFGASEIYRKDGILTTVQLENHIECVLYPNPTSDIITIKSGSQIDDVTLFDLNGNQVIETKFDASTSTIDVRLLASGVYIVKVTAGKQNEFKRIVKQ